MEIPAFAGMMRWGGRDKVKWIASGLFAPRNDVECGSKAEENVSSSEHSGTAM